MKYLLSFLSIIAITTFYACGDDNPTGFNLVNAAKNCAPTFTSASTASLDDVFYNEVDETLKSLKGKFTYCGDESKDYQDDAATTCGTNNGVDINISNIYKLLFQTQDYLDGYASTCTNTVSATQTVKIAYDDGTTFIQSDAGDMACTHTETEDATTHRYKGAAWKKTDTTYNFGVLYDHQDADDEALTYGSYDETTHIFNLILALYTSNTGSYLWLEGNTNDHTFTFHDGTCFGHGKSSRFTDTVEVSSVSSNAVTDDYIYVTCDNDGDGSLGTSGDKEYCLKASDATVVTPLNTQCTEYKDYLDQHDGSDQGDDDYIATPWQHDADGDGNSDNYAPTQHFSHDITIQ